MSEGKIHFQIEMENSLKAIKAAIATSNSFSRFVDVVALHGFYLMMRR